MPEIVEHIGLMIRAIGVTVILWGVLLGVLRLVLLNGRASAAGILSSNVKTCGITSGLHSGASGHLHRQLSSDATTMRGGRKRFFAERSK
jgi:hypothetical protein